jgi:CHRD domain-containing protein/PEP-CTERM motif-containing protein
MEYQNLTPPDFQTEEDHAMYRTLGRTAVIAVALFLLALPVQATIIDFSANLSGLQENPQNASPASGTGTVVLNDVAHSITVDLSWTGLSAPATTADIHGPAPLGVNAPLIFPFAGVPAATAGSIPEQTFAITGSQIADLENGQYYFNVHDANFPGGEIRGQIAPVPEPGTLLLVGSGLLGVMGLRKKLKK